MIENGKRPMTKLLATACDAVFPERKGWYLAEYEETRSWIPPSFRDWREHEDSAKSLLVWSPGAVDGLVQTERYARALLSLYPGVTPDVVEVRLRNRMERQARLLREDGSTIGLLVDHAALYRAVGSAEIMAEQCVKLTNVAKMVQVTVQVVPAVMINLATALVILADDAAYTENALTGAAYDGEEPVTRLRRLIGSVRAEARPASESLALIKEAERKWTGVSRATAATVERPVSK